MKDVSGSLFSFICSLLLTFTRGTWLGASVVHVSVCVVADDSPTSDETGPAAEGVCCIVILRYVIFVNVFTGVEELWEGFETAKGLPCVALHDCFMQPSLA